jgi:hypothetical protein
MAGSDVVSLFDNEDSGRYNDIGDRIIDISARSLTKPLCLKEDEA